MTKSVREIIKEIQMEVRQSEDLLPDRAAELLAQLASLLGNCNDEIRRRMMDYNKVLLLSYETTEKANRAKILAENDPSYEARQEAKDTKELCLELIRSLKYFLRAKSDEYKYSGSQ